MSRQYVINLLNINLPVWFSVTRSKPPRAKRYVRPSWTDSITTLYKDTIKKKRRCFLHYHADHDMVRLLFWLYDRTYVESAHDRLKDLLFPTSRLHLSATWNRRYGSVHFKNTSSPGLCPFLSHKHHSTVKMPPTTGRILLYP